MNNHPASVNRQRIAVRLGRGGATSQRGNRQSRMPRLSRHQFQLNADAALCNLSAIGNNAVSAVSPAPGKHRALRQ
jgi:hypothetical protein